MRVIVYQLEVLGAEGKNVIGGIYQAQEGERAWFTLEHRADVILLIEVNVGVGNSVDVLSRLETGDVSDGEQEGGILDEVGRDADRQIAGALEHVE